MHEHSICLMQVNNTKSRGASTSQFQHRNPVFVVVGTEGVDAEGLGDFAVAGAVVDEEGLVGGGLLALEHHLEDGWRWLHQSALVAEVEVVEVVVDGVVAAIKVWCACPLHHIGVGVREQTYFVALCSKVEQGIEVALGYVLDIAVPGVVALVGSDLVANNLTQFHTKFFCRDTAYLEVSEDALLAKCVEVLAGIFQSDFLEAGDGVLVAECQHDATQVECEILNLIHIVTIVTVILRLLDQVLAKVGHRVGEPRR